MSRQDQVMLRVVGASLACLAAGVYSVWFLFGVLSFVILCALFVLGFAETAWRKSLLYFAGMWLLLVACLFVIDETFDPAQPPRMLGGLPLGTGILIYIIWPSGILSGLFYAFNFRTAVLPPERLQRFRDEIAKDDDS